MKRKIVRGAAAAFIIAFAAINTAPQAWAAEFITFNVFSGQVGSEIAVSGGGYAGGETVSIYTGNVGGAPLAQTVSDAIGFFGPVNITIPIGTLQGNIPVIAVGGTSGRASSNTFFAISLTPQISASSSVNTPGGIIDITGSGFTPNEGVSIKLGTTENLGTADGSGAISETLVIPALEPATYQIEALGLLSNANAIAFFYVGGFFPTITPSSYFLMPGEAISFSGSGFMPGETIDIQNGSTPGNSIASTAADGSGNFINGGAINIGIDQAGAIQTYFLRGLTSNGSAQVMITIGGFNSNVFPSSFFVLPGESLNFSGSGFFGGEPIDVRDGAAILASFNANGVGEFANEGNLIVPMNWTNQTKLLTAGGRTSGASFDVAVMIGSFFPNINPSSYFVLPGENFTASGSGFAPNEDVSISFGAETVMTHTDSLGAFSSTTIKTPFGTAPLLPLRATGSLTSTTITAQITIGSFFPGITPSQYYALPGSKISFAGSGFAAEENIVISSSEGFAGQSSSSPNGEFTAGPFTIPFNVLRNTLTFNFTGALSEGAASVSIIVPNPAPYASADNYYALPGTTINISGFAFGANEPVTVSSETNSIATASDEAGSVGPISITLPFESESETANITLQGGISGATASVPITLAPFSPQVNPSIWWTMPGSEINFEGTGFAPGETIAITKTDGTTSETPADSTGAFTASTTIPINARGSENFLFTGSISGSTNSISIGLGEFTPFITLDNYYAVGGTPITITGGGFAANEPLNINFGGANIIGAITDNLGSLNFETAVPFANEGVKTVLATGSISGALGQTSFTQAPIFTSIQFAAYAGAPGDAVTMIGSGYLSDEPVQIIADRIGIPHSFTANNLGNFLDSGFTIPAVLSGGPLQITIIGTQSLSSKTILYYVTGA